MLCVVACPSCGQKLRIADEQLGRQFKCQGCNELFRASRYEVLAKKPAKEPTPDPDPLFIRWGKKAGADGAVMLDGAIGGAIGGIVVGLLVGSFAGGAQPAADAAVGGAIGNVMSGFFFGFIAGFGAGVCMGFLLGVSARFIKTFYELKSQQASVLSGALTGATVAALLGDYRWALIGAVLGSFGAALWALLHGWAESYMPPAPDKVFGEESIEEEEQRVRRLEIDHTQGHYPRRPDENGRDSQSSSVYRPRL